MPVTADRADWGSTTCSPFTTSWPRRKPCRLSRPGSSWDCFCA